MDFATVFMEVYPSLLSGLQMTLKASLLAIFIAFFLGLGSCILGMSKIKPLAWISKIYIWIIRGIY